VGVGTPARRKKKEERRKKKEEEEEEGRRRKKKEEEGRRRSSSSSSSSRTDRRGRGRTEARRSSAVLSPRRGLVVLLWARKIPGDFRRRGFLSCLADC
jgi:hypothetical protein